MANHFSTIGLPAKTRDEIDDLLLLAMERGRLVPAEGGQYIRWQVGHGAELWLQLDADGYLMGANPHFSGETTMRVRLTGRVP